MEPGSGAAFSFLLHVAPAVDKDHPHSRKVHRHVKGREPVIRVLLGKCEQLWVFGGEVSDGMRREIGKAKQKNMTIRYFTEDMEETECR